MLCVISRDLVQPLILECLDSSKLRITIIHFDGCVIVDYRNTQQFVHPLA